MLLVSCQHRISHSRASFAQHAIKCHTVGLNEVYENSGLVKNKWLNNLVVTKQRKIPVPKIPGLEQLGKKEKSLGSGFFITTKPKEKPSTKAAPVEPTFLHF